jgi:peroxiredoxin
LAQLRQVKNEFDEKGAQILLVGIGSEKETETYRKTYAPEFPMVYDPERRLHQAFQLKQTSLLKMTSASLLLKSINVIGKGYGLGLPRGNIYQLPGVFIIDTMGVIRYSYFSRDPADRPNPEELLFELAKIE